MNESYPRQHSHAASTGWIICGGQHDLSGLTSQPQPLRQETNWSLVTVLVIIPIALITGFFFIMTPNYIRRIRDSEEYGTLYRLRGIAEAEDSYRKRNGRYGTFDELMAARELNSRWNKPMRLGYFFSIKVSDKSLEISAIPYSGESRCSFLVVIEADNDNHAIVYSAENQGHRVKKTDNLIGESFGNDFNWFPSN